MDIVTILLSLAGISALGIMSPGPDFIAVTYASVTSTRAHAAAVALGVVLGNGMWAGAALFGVGTLFILFPTFFLIFKVIGGSYLVWMGFRMIFKSKKPIISGNTIEVASKFTSVLKGFSTTISNPKAAIYYASALTTLAPPDASIRLLAVMVSVVFLVAAIWFTCVVLFLSTPRASRVYKNIKIYLEATFGSLIVVFGLKQILS